MRGRPHLVPAVIVAAMLLIAIAPLPYGYYQFLRWATCGVAVFIAVKSYNWKQAWGTWLFAAVAILFNPLVPIHLTKEVWQPIDFVVALVFAMSMVIIRQPAKT